MSDRTVEHRSKTITERMIKASSFLRLAGLYPSVVTQKYAKEEQALRRAARKLRTASVSNLTAKPTRYRVPVKVFAFRVLPVRGTSNLSPRKFCPDLVFWRAVCEIL